MAANTVDIRETIRAVKGVNPYGFDNVLDIANGTNTLTLDKDVHGGKLLITLDATLVLTLPTIVDTTPADSSSAAQACNWGLTFNILLGIASTAFSLDTDGTDEFVGALTILSEGIAEAGAHTTTFYADGTDVSIDCAGSVDGGVLGSFLSVTSTNQGWYLNGNSQLLSTGTVVTPFA